MSIETIALLMAPVGGLLLGLFVYVLVVRDTRRHDAGVVRHKRPAE